MSVLVQHVVGEFDLLKADSLFHEVFPCEGGVRVEVEAGRQGRVGFTCHQPG